MKVRTTLTLDSEIADLVRKEAAETRRRFGDVLNERLRLSFAQMPQTDTTGSNFVVKPFATSGFAPGIDESRLNQLLDALETERLAP